MDNIKVLVKEPGKKPEFKEIPNTLEALQNIVGGYIEAVTISSDMAVICNEEGRLLDMEPCCVIAGVDFVGPVIILGVNGEDFADIPLSSEDVMMCFANLWYGV